MLQVSRTTFHDSGAAFTETCPEIKHDESEHEQITCCSRTVHKKPPTTDPIHQIKYSLYMTHNDMTASEQTGFFIRSSGTRKFDSEFTLWFRKDYQMAKNPDAHGSVYCTIGSDSLRFQYHLLNYGYVDCVFFTLYFGPGVDCSNLYSGHSHPKLKFPKIESTDVWMYKNNFQVEHFGMVTKECDGLLREIFDDGNVLLKKIGQVLDSATVDTIASDLYKQINQDDLKLFERVAKKIDSFDLENHPIFAKVQEQDVIDYGIKDGRTMFQFGIDHKKRDGKYLEKQKPVKRQKSEPLTIHDMAIEGDIL